MGKEEYIKETIEVFRSAVYRGKGFMFIPAINGFEVFEIDEDIARDMVKIQALRNSEKRKEKS